ncbi:MAG: GatB/YqeY domain-containing protein [bacterium]|nr:GatB/YqeY domain-containing protein [bacterium]
MSVQQQIKDDARIALKARDEVRLTTLRGLVSAFTNELVAQKKKPDEELPDTDAFAVLKRAVKQRKDSIEQFQKGNRADLVEREQAELAVIEQYLPSGVSEEEIVKAAKDKIESMGITDKAKAGIVVGAVMKDLKGNADGSEVKKIVESLLR